MFVKQISVFIENRHGRLAELTRLLGTAGIDLIALSVADTTDFGILRAITSDTDRAAAVLREADCTLGVTDVLGICVPDEPGGLANVIDVLSENGVSIEYIYSFVRNINGKAGLILRVDKPCEAHRLLEEKGVTLLSQADIT